MVKSDPFKALQKPSKLPLLFDAAKVFNASSTIIIGLSKTVVDYHLIVKKDGSKVIACFADLTNLKDLSNQHLSLYR